MKTLQQIQRFKIVTSTDSRSYKSTTKSFQIFPNRKGGNFLNLLVLWCFLITNQCLYFHVNCASLFNFNEVLKFDEGICKYLSKMRTKRRCCKP